MDLLANIIVIFLALWVLGISFASSVGSLIHLFLVMAILLIAVRLFKPLHIIANSILGIALFFLMNAIFSVGIPITLLSVGVVAIGGIPGVTLVFFLHLTGLGF